MYSMSFRNLKANITSFDYSIINPPNQYPFNVTIGIRSAGLPSPYRLTNERVATALSILGNHFDQYRDLSKMRGCDFDIVIVYFSVGILYYIGHGFIDSVQ